MLWYFRTLVHCFIALTVSFLSNNCFCAPLRTSDFRSTVVILVEIYLYVRVCMCILCIEYTNRKDFHWGTFCSMSNFYLSKPSAPFLANICGRFICNVMSLCLFLYHFIYAQYIYVSDCECVCIYECSL